MDQGQRLGLLGSKYIMHVMAIGTKSLIDLYPICRPTKLRASSKQKLLEMLNG